MQPQTRSQALRRIGTGSRINATVLLLIQCLIFQSAQAIRDMHFHIPTIFPRSGSGVTKPIRKSETDRGGAFEHAPGSGGPTGCREAYLTVMGDDGFLAGVLILLHTVRRYAYIDRDFVVIVSTAVTQPTIERLQEECVRRSQLCRTRELVSSVEFDLTACKILAAGFDRNELAQQLVAKSARYRSGYWVIKMFVWRLEEYSKLVYIDGDVYFRQSADELFCSPVSPK
eukprot:1194313-Prorocentrum_minimum.AAC.1